MADVIKKTTNRFTKGMILDFSPENTENKVLTHALNATLLTFNGNELSLQNDMGNSRVESAYLPDGYIPVGTCEYGGIIYIVSYNPLEDKSQIGCFPSPERVINRDELGLEEVCITKDFFQEIDKGIITGKINHNTLYVLLKNSNLNPGDKFIIYADNILNEKLKDLYYQSLPVSNPVIALNVVSIEDSGKIVYLNNTVKQYSKEDYSYHILLSLLDQNNKFTEINTDIDLYRDVLNSGYNVFRSKTSGKLAILAELIMIDSYSVTHRLEPQKYENNKIKEGIFDIVLHTEVTPEITKENYRTVPKLQYYYLKNSQGYLLTGTETITLFNNNIINNSINSTKLSALYEPIDNNIINDLETALNTSDFKFPKASTYHSNLKNYEGDFNELTSEIYTKFIQNKYHRIDITLIKDELYFISKDAKFYYYNELSDSYIVFTEDTLIDKYEYYIKHNKNIYNDVKRDTKYLGQILYKIKNEIRNADTSIIENPLIEKYKELKIYIYREALSTDVNQKLYYTTDGGHTYNELVGDKQSGVTYYTLTVESNYVSVGNVINNPIGIYYYYPGTTDYIEASYEEIIDYFDFDKFPYKSEAPYGSPLTLYYQTVEEIYEKASEENLKDFNKPGMVLYYKTNYFLIPNLEDYNEDNLVFILFKNNTLIPLDKFKPHTDYNYINGNTVNQIYPNESPIYVYTTEWGESQNTESMIYEDVILATIKLPDVVVDNALDLPFKYDYTIVPCMNYGRLDHLAISNTVDFSKLHAFNLSNFTTWKYRIEDNQLRLTFGADIYDTYEDDKVDGLILEFYDCQGFAGSLEIVDKKSYSGVFTKIIPLNSLNALSKKRIYNGLVQENYTRNINMPLDYEGWDAEVGWSEESLKEGLKNSSLEIYNDCGTLYSNILYGVKTFLRRTKKISNNEFKLEFILKKNFFLYTLPIYNDYYFTVNDFTNLTYPELNFILTYKLKDASSKSVFTNDIINNGYTDADKSIINSYLGGFYKEKSLDITKYYKYEGTTDLYLEIGLEKSYENLNISYDPSINSIFGCTLKLISDHDINNPITVSSDMEGLTGDSAILNYKDLINLNDNILDFENPDSNPYQKTITSLSNHMFVNILENTLYEPIKINYKFIVGYNTRITDIRETQVQATTVCALCHKQPNTNTYNYADFGVYENDGKFLSNTMFYNEGTSKEEIFGICQLINIEGTMSKLCLKGPNVVTEAQKITTSGKLNTGEPLKQLINNIGKLTFCQPHVHGLSDQINGVNVYYKMTNNLDKNTLILYPEYGDIDIGNHKEDNYGTYATSDLFNTPKYNLVVNTKNSINYSSEFISTMDFKETTSRFYKYDYTGGAGGGYTDGEIAVREFTGLTGELLELFNKKLVETFKNVYAYNPDYDSLTVNKGSVLLQNYNPNFLTNIISTDSFINYSEKDNLNNYIYLGPVKFSNYLNKLQDRSNILVKENYTFLPQVQLKENLLYCGVKGSNYLISSLTYNTPVPSEIEQELEFSASNLTVVKHQDGLNSFIEGTPSKKALYGFLSKYNKMIELDVSNYEIANDGTLSIIDSEIKEPIQCVKELNITKSNQLQNYLFDYPFKNGKNELSNLKIALDLNINNFNSQELLGFSQFLDEIIMAVKIIPDFGFYVEGGLSIFPLLRVISSDSSYSYEINPTNLEFDFKYVELNDKMSLHSWSYDKPSLYNQSLDTINKFFNKYGEITIEGHSDYVGNYLLFKDTYLLEPLNINNLMYHSYDGSFINAIVDLSTNKDIKIKCRRRLETQYQYTILLMSFKFNKLAFTITLKSKLENIKENFVKVVKTKKYTDDSILHKYKVDEKYNKARIRGTSITLNDLEYQSNNEGHRLFVRNGLHNYDSYLRNKIYYRKLEDGRDSYYKDTKYLNNIFLYTGPCFTADNLNDE